jgi:hypothetical protein
MPAAVFDGLMSPLAARRGFAEERRLLGFSSVVVSTLVDPSIDSLTVPLAVNPRLTLFVFREDDSAVLLGSFLLLVWLMG